MAWTIVGLGNPGEEYIGTRHNIGRDFLMALAKKEGITQWKEDTKLRALTAKGDFLGSKVLLVLPETFMNNSGGSLKPLIDSKKKLEQLIVVHDELDLPLGKVKISVGSGPGGVSIAFALAGGEVTGIDIEQELHDISLSHVQAYTQEIRTPIQFVLYDGMVLPFADSTFDYAVSVSVLEHTSDPELYLSQIARVLKPGGKLYLAFPNKLWPKETHTQIWFLTYFPAFLRPYIIKILRRNPLEENNLHFYTYFDLLQMLRHVHADGYHLSIVPEAGRAVGGVKKIVKDVLSVFGISYKSFLSHVSVILEKI